MSKETHARVSLGPIPDLAHARQALARAHLTPNPKESRDKVLRLYPELKKRAQKHNKPTKK